MHLPLRHWIKPALTAVALLHAGIACAVLYTWVDADGSKHVSDRPPSGEVYTTKRNNGNTASGTAPGGPLFVATGASAAAASTSQGASAAAAPR